MLGERGKCQLCLLYILKFPLPLFFPLPGLLFGKNPACELGGAGYFQKPTLLTAYRGKEGFWRSIFPSGYSHHSQKG